MQGLQTMTFENIYGRFVGGELSHLEAPELLGVGERTFRPGACGFARRARTGWVTAGSGRLRRTACLRRRRSGWRRWYQERYQGFTAKHFHEHLARLPKEL